MLPRSLLSDDVPPPAQAIDRPLASLVVLNWKDERSTARCVRSLKALDRIGECEIIVVDNESTAASRAALQAVGADRLVSDDRNRGFAGGMNAGMAVAQGQYVALLNNDLVVDPGWLVEGLRVLRDPEVGIVGGVARAWDGDSEPSPTAEGLGIVHVDPRRCFSVLGPVGPAESVVAAVDGSNLLLPAQRLVELGGFDESYFAYYEDVDLCARLYALGYCSVRSPRMRSWHRRGGSTSAIPTRRAFWAARNQMLTVAKHFPHRAWLRTLLAVVKDDAVAAALGTRAGWRRRTSESRLGRAERIGLAGAVGWIITHPRRVLAARGVAIAQGQHDEAYVDHLQRLASREESPT